MWVSPRTDIIGKVLPSAVRLFIRSRVEQIEELKLQVQGHDRQILGGYIPGVSVSVREAIYEGLHLGETSLRGENIRLNIGQVLRGKPLQLLEPIRLGGEAKIDEAKLNRSIPSFILSNALTDLLILLLENNGIAGARELVRAKNPRWTEIQLNDGYFLLRGTIEEETPIALVADLQLENPRTLTIVPRALEGFSEGWAMSPRPFTVDLGSEVEIEEFILRDRALSCRGKLVIQP